MTKRTVEHEIKLEKSVKVILGVLAFGVFLNAFAPAFDVRKAFAELSSEDHLNVYVTGGKIGCAFGCR